MQRLRHDGDLVRSLSPASILTALLLMAVAGMTVLVVADPSAPPSLFGADRWWQDLVGPWPTWTHDLAQWLASLGSGWVMVPLRVGVGLWLAARRRWLDLAAWMAAWAVADALTAWMKPSIGRLRPDASDTTSFPSGHAKTAAQTAVSLVLVWTSPWRSRARWWALALAWTLVMALSRTVLDVHYLSDVVAGSLLGAACAIGAGVVVQRARDRRGLAPKPAPGGH